MKLEKNTATKPARISPKMSSTNRFHSTAAKLPDRRSFPQLRTDVDTQGEKHHWSLHRSFIDPSSAQDHPKTAPRPPKDQDKTAHWKSIDFSSQRWFGDDVGHGHFYRESLCENDNSMKQATHKCRFFFQMLIWHWRWRWALLQRILVRESQFYETREAQM